MRRNYFKNLVEENVVHIFGAGFIVFKLAAALSGAAVFICRLSFTLPARLTRCLKSSIEGEKAAKKKLVI